MSGIETAGSDGGELLGANHPLVCGAVPLPPPLTTTAPLLLNTHQLSWEAVEHLVAALALKVDQAREARLYGRRGQDQQGIDVVAFFGSHAPTVYQAKNYKSFTAGDLRAAVTAFTGGRRPFQAGRLVVVTTASVADTRIDEELAALRERHSDLQIDLWGQQQLSDVLYEEPDVVRRFFGEATMQVFCRPLAVQNLPPSGVAKLNEVTDYLREFSASLAVGLHENVPLNVRVEKGNDTLPSIDLATWLREGGHAQLVGPSGSGKSHAMAHTAVELAGSGCFPILVRAGVYQGRLEPWLDEAVAPYSTYRATELIDAARRHGCPVIVLVDATNECPETLRTTLVEQLSAWYRRTGVIVMACGQNYLDVPTALSGARLRLLAPDTGQRKALLRSYGAEDIEERCDAFNTPLELALAARLAHQLPMRAGRAELLDAYVRDRLRTCTRPTVIRHVLQQWALLMDQRLMTWLPLAEAERVAVRELTQNEVPMSVVEEILSSPLVEVSKHRVGFCHELFGRLFTAEELMRQHTDPVELAGELARPQHGEIRELALPLEGNPEKLLVLLSALCDGKILTEALRGRLGQLADEVTYIEARRILDEAMKAMSTARVVFPSDFASTFSCRVEIARRPWSDYEVAMFGAVGATAHDGRMLDKVLELLRQTDAACQRDTEGSRGTRQQVSPSMIASVLCGPVYSEPQRLPAYHIFKSMQFHLSVSRNTANLHGYAEACALASALETVRSEDIGPLLILCKMVSCADDSDVVRLMPEVLAKAWESGAYHLRLEGLKSAMSVRSHADALTTAQIIEQLEMMTTGNIWLSTALVDALNVYGLVESPFAVEDIASDIAEVLAYPKNPDAQTRAGTILNNQFEDVIAEPFVEAVSALDDAQRTSLYVLATSSGDAHLFTSIYLRELLRAGDSAAMVSYRHWALKLNIDNPVPQETVACHLLGIQGCAAHTETPPELLTEHDGPDAEAWRCYGQILFWLHRPDLSATRRDEYCRPLWRLLTTDLRDAAVDPLRKMRSSVLFSDDLPYAALGRFMEIFPSEIREILHHGLAAPQRMTSLFPHGGLLDNDDVVIWLTAEVGDASSLPYLRPYIDDPGVGVSAVQAWRRIKRRIEG
ncbi:ATP-binding protein [Nocardiopsis dassonvillei]|uniref:ATP-binding protein n=1 Tax=Nocardiopsis dassonvillei TaxID=2014 RepID=UPI0020A5215D|nr:ATP-binding protein [Nocardiopsis dassonvillei]MCP3017363.1 ATP-binding protein [Nocardiopsis dassonvillei]